MSDDDRDNDIESDADKRAHHNALERKRRDHIKDSFSSLRDALPSLTGEKSLQNQSTEQANNSTGHSEDANSSKKKASRAQILKKAADYIQSMRRKNSAHQQDIEDLKRQNKLLEEQIRSLEKSKTTGSYATSPVTDATPLNSKGDSISAFDGGSDSESSDTEGSKDAGRKRLKTEPSFRP